MSYLTLVILLLLFSWLVYRYFLQADLNKKDVLLGWGIKIIMASFFMYMFSYYHTEQGSVQLDVGNFIHDSQVLAEYGKNDPSGYLKLLMGIDSDNPDVLLNDLIDTKIWDYGNNGDQINDSRLIIRINSVIQFISNGNIWVHTLVFAFLSFFGITLIFRSFVSMVKRKKLFYYTLLLTPTLAFWGSGLCKESLFILSFGILVFGIFKLKKKVNLFSLLLLLIAIGLLLMNKTHVGLILLPMSILPLITLKTGFNRKIALVFSALLIGGFVSLCFTPSQLNILDRISNKQSDFINLAQGGVFFINDSSFCTFDYSYLDHFTYFNEDKLITVNEPTPGEYKLFGEKEFYPFDIEASQKKYEAYLILAPASTYVATEKIEGSKVQLAKNTPSSIFNVMIRPLPTDEGPSLKYVIFIENLALIAFLIFAFVKRRKLEENEKVWLYYLIVSALLLILIIGWTTPVIGAIIRYKMAPLLLLILSAFILMGSPKKIKT